MHGHWNFGYGLNNTSYIEQFLNRIKYMRKKFITKFLKMIIYYVKEAEFRSFLNKDKLADKEKIIYKLLKDV